MEQSCTRRDSGSPLSIVGCHTLHRASSLQTHLGLSNHLTRVGTAAHPCPRLPVPHPSSSFLPPNTPWFEQPSYTRRDSSLPDRKFVREKKKGKEKAKRVPKIVLSYKTIERRRTRMDASDVLLAQWTEQVKQIWSGMHQYRQESVALAI